MTHWSASVATLESHFSGSMVRENLYGLRFADWDSDGDMDALVAENKSLWFYERLPGDSFEKHKLMPFWQNGFEVADWDGDLQLFDFHWFLVLWRFLCTKTCSRG